MATGNFNGNGAADLAVGAPFEDAGRVVDAGAVSVLYGSASGLSRAGGQILTQVGSAPETDDLFGFNLAAGDFNGNGTVDLAVAAPGEGVGSIPFAGAVSVLNGSGSGLTAAGGYLFHQNSPGVGSSAEAGDFFGGSLAAGDPATATATASTAAGPAAGSNRLRPAAS